MFIIIAVAFIFNLVLNLYFISQLLQKP